MAIITCGTCGKKYSDKAPSCPFCEAATQHTGVKIPTSWKRIGSLIFLSLFAFFFIIVTLSEKPQQPRDRAPVKQVQKKPDTFDAFSNSHQFIEERLKSPSTADFASYSKSTISEISSGRFLIVSYVDSQNGFGATIRTKYACILSTNVGKFWKLEELTFNN